MAARKKWSAIPTALHNHYERQIRVRNNHQNHSLIEGLQWKIIISCEWTYCFQMIYNFIDWRIVNLIYWSNYYVVINSTLFWVWPVPKKKISWTTPMLNARFLCTCIRSPLRLKKEQTNEWPENRQTQDIFRCKCSLPNRTHIYPVKDYFTVKEWFRVLFTISENHKPQVCKESKGVNIP